MKTDCTKNAFCSSLPDDVRRNLCNHCHRRLAKAGSFELYRDFERHATLILDGAIMSSIHSGEDVLHLSKHVPTFYLGLPGRMLATNTTFKQDDKMYYGDNGMECLTDCCIASFEHEIIRDFFFEDRTFSQSMALSMLRIMEDACEMSAILRAQSVYLSVSYLTRLLTSYRLFLSQQQIATILNRDRASVSKAAARLKVEDGTLVEDFLSNRKRPIAMQDPH